MTANSLVRCNVLGSPLFEVGKDLVPLYNEALYQTTGKRTTQTSFFVDKRGVSPQLEEELGAQYLQNGPAHRFLLIVSPEQKSAPLLSEEFTFDSEIIDAVYRNCYSAISLATKRDCLYGELNDSVEHYETIADLLAINKIEVDLHTPSQFLNKARSLIDYVQQLKSNPKLLVKDASKHLHEMLRLVREVGDVRGYSLKDTSAELEVGTFGTTFFDETYIFREVAKGRRTKNSRDLQTTVLYTGLESHVDSDSTRFISLQRPEQVVDFLLDQKYVTLDSNLVKSRLTREEDHTILERGYDVASMSANERQIVLAKVKERSAIWKTLQKMQGYIHAGHSFQDLLEGTSPQIKLLLARSSTQKQHQKDVVNAVLSSYTKDYPALFETNRLRLEKLLSTANPHTQKYIIKTITEREQE